MPKLGQNDVRDRVVIALNPSMQALIWKKRFTQLPHLPA